MPTRKKMSRDMRKNLIEGLVYRSPEPMRVLDIARAMGMVRSPYLTGLIDELVNERRLATTEVELAPDLIARAYIAPRLGVQ
ncbi:MAG TPA: hypothetical protein V6C97_27140 [Oculatellaceae cyanobacterium]